MREQIKALLTPIGLDQAGRWAFVQGGMAGERIKFWINGRPPADKAILLAGSGRSGTTWLASILASIKGVQPIFEPLFPLSNPKVRRLAGWDQSDPYLRGIYLRASGEYSEWKEHWRDILTGRMRNYWTDYERLAFFPDRFLIKEIRANMMLGFIYDNFKPKIVYIIRHPCAVVNSRIMLKKPWQAEVKDLLKQEELVEDHLRPWLKEIEGEKDLVGAHAVWWAVEHKVAQAELACRPHYQVTYEELVLDARIISKQILDWLGAEANSPKFEKALQRQSGTVHPGIKNRNQLSRLSAWKERLSSDEQKKILAWANRLGISSYTEDILPASLKGL